MESEAAALTSLPGRILIVEDDRQILSIVSLLLEDEGYEVLTASDGKQALARLREGPPPDLIILDLMLPTLDGWEFRTIQRADPSLANIPVLAVSADSSAKAAAIDATSFLRKPFGAEDLLARVHKLLGERVRLEARTAETERMVALGKLAAVATHEISNPLGSVVANISSVERLIRRMQDLVQALPHDQAHPVEAALAERGMATVEDIQDTLQDIQLGTERMRQVLAELRDRVRKPRQPFGAVDLRVVLESAIALTSHEIRRRAKLVIDLGGAGPAVRGNELRLGQLFTNLLINAAHAIPPGQPESNRISVLVQEGPHALVVAIEDTGCGMTPEVRARLFEPFFTTKVTGTGLGLAICQSIAQEHLGEIAVESAPGQGTRFRVTLPLDHIAVEAAYERFVRVPDGPRLSRLAPLQVARPKLRGGPRPTS
jgi:signal transduction histidine kinase